MDAMLCPPWNRCALNEALEINITCVYGFSQGGGKAVDELLSIGALAKLAGVPPRTVQFWADSGVLLPSQDTNRRGKGAHRRFSATEGILAKIAARMARMNCPIGELKAVTDKLRSLSISPESDHLFSETENLLNGNKESSGNLFFSDLYRSVFNQIEYASVRGVNSGESGIVLLYDESDNDLVTHVVIWIEDKKWTSFFANPMFVGSFICKNVVGYKFIDASLQDIHTFIGYEDRSEINKAAMIVYYRSLQLYVDVLSNNKRISKTPGWENVVRKLHDAIEHALKDLE
jgi:DNA-binding transcriptional MerR regulator